MGQYQAMSEAEKKVMKIIWENGGSIFFPELAEELGRRGEAWRAETIRTFVKRLVAKGFVGVERHGQMSRYLASVSEEEYLAQQARHFVNSVFDGNARGLVASLFGQGALKQTDIEELRRFWDEGKGDRDA